MRMNFASHTGLGQLARSLSYNKKAGIMELAAYQLEQSSWLWRKDRQCPLLRICRWSKYGGSDACSAVGRTDICYGYSSTAMLYEVNGPVRVEEQAPTAASWYLPDPRRLCNGEGNSVSFDAV